ncbi:MAG: linear amide C-N hydrolase [Clostridia bacterium]|nr:linear amide C-N hydrolase [Clostridia bacterium]
MENMEEKKITVTEETSEKSVNESEAQAKEPPKKKKRIWLRVLLGIILTPILLALVAAIAVFVILYGRLTTMASAEQVGHNLYKIHYQQDYALDKALAADIKTEQDLLNFINEEMYFGYGIDANIDKYACSGFLSRTDGGKYLTGRSFGLGGTDKLAVYSTPRKGYKSLSMVSLDMLGVGGKDGPEALSTEGRIAMLAAPYICMDGVNEKGVFAALMDVDTVEIHDDTERPELIVTLAVRLILDRAASVDEAIELLRQYDIHTGHGWVQHIFITDATGDAAVVEWARDDTWPITKKSVMHVTRSKMCTNFFMYQFEGKTEGICERYDAMTEALEGKEEITHEYAMDILESVYQYIDEYTFTDWSVIYYQTDFTMDVATNRDFDTIYHLEPGDF